MPFIDVRVFEGQLTAEQTEALIQGITDVMASVISEKLREDTWVVVTEVKNGYWDVGGKPWGLEDVQKLING